MRMFKWWLVAELYICAALASAAGRQGIAIMLSLVATVALLVALELATPADDDDEHGLTIERLALVLVYAWQHHNTYTASAHRKYVGYCRRRALGIGSW